MTSRRREIQEAFEWEDDYDKVLALAHLADEKRKRPGLGYNSLSKVERVALHIVQFDGEIANGGWHQFFTNSTGLEWRAILESLNTIQARNTVGLFEQALAVFPDNTPASDAHQIEQQLQIAGEMALQAFSRLEEKYFTQSERIFTLAAAYLIINKSAFL